MTEARKEIESLKQQLAEQSGPDSTSRSSKYGSKQYTHGLIDLLLILQPNMVINHIAGPNFKAEAHFTRHNGATVLFADISGYTALAQTLGAAGAAGTELLSRSLDDFFKIAIESIYRWNGDVIKFCGDAILCVFLPDRVQTAMAAAAAAAQCAVELKAKLRGFQAAEGVVLDLKLMLGHGEIIGNYVGDPSLSHLDQTLMLLQSILILVHLHLVVTNKEDSKLIVLRLQEF